MISDSKPGLKYYIMPFLIQFGVLGVCIPLHRIFIHIGPYLGSTEMVGMEMSDPTAGRLAFAIISFIGSVILALCASHKSRSGKDLASFVYGMFAGTLLWQSIGEDLWNFSVDGMHFVSLESIAVLPLVIIYIMAMVYAWKKGADDWGIWCTVLAFSVNWLGHYVLIGIYPLLSNLCEINSWCMGAGISLGSVLLALSLFTGLRKEAAPRKRMLSAILGYYAVAVLAFGIVGI